MMKYYWYAILLNYVSGFFLFIVFSLWFMSFIYIAETIGWIIDPTLDEGLLFILLFISITVSLIFFPALIISNIKISEKINFSKNKYALFAIGILISGFASFFSILYFLR